MDRLFRTAAAILRNKEDAEDIVQDVFVKWHEKQPEFSSAAHETAWFLRVTINLCRSRLRSPWRRRSVPLLHTYPARNDGEREVMESVLALPVKFRTVIYLFYFEGYATAEIAEITGQKESTVRQQLTRARRMLKVELMEGALT
jgi:RNA polymerase sigma-70 factor (ECF subfamily)